MFSSLVQVERHADGIYSAPESPDKGERMFGGQFLAQCLAAAQAEMDADRGVHSLHGYFLRPGDVHLPLLLRVETVRDGRSFSSRQVTAEQRGKELFRLLASFKTPDETPEFAAFPMPEAPPADSVAKTYDAFTREMSGEEYWAGNARHMDIRYVNPPTAPRGVPVTEPQLTWMRIKDPLPEDADVHWAGIAYLSDSTLVDSHRAAARHALAGPGLRRHQPRSRHVVPSSGPRRRVAAVRADGRGHRQRARPGERPHLY